MGEHGTTTKLTQFVTLGTHFQKALSIVVDQIGIKSAIKGLENQTERLAVMLKLVIRAMLTGEELSLGKFPVWRTLEIGRGPSHIESLLQECFTDPTETIAEMRFLSKPTVVKLVKLQAWQFGLDEDVSLPLVCDLATLKYGLQLCPDEVGPNLRLDYPDQPKDEVLVVASKIPNSYSPSGQFCTYTVSGSNGRDDLGYGVFNIRICPFDTVVFVQP